MKNKERINSEVKKTHIHPAMCPESQTCLKTAEDEKLSGHGGRVLTRTIDLIPPPELTPEIRFL